MPPLLLVKTKPETRAKSDIDRPQIGDRSAFVKLSSVATMSVETVVLDRMFDRSRLARAADWLAIAVAVSLPWSTSASGILIGIWVAAVIPTLDVQTLRRTMAIPAAAIPAALFALALIGMAWATASPEEQFGSIKSFLRLLAFALLFVHFRRSDRGMWVLAGFLASCTALLALSWIIAVWPALAWRPEVPAGVPVKDYIIQSGEFLICAFALAHLGISAWRDGRWARAFALALWALAFLASIVFVATGRSTLVIGAALLPLLALQRFNWRGILAVSLAGIALAAAAWASSPYLRARVLAVAQEAHEYLTEDARTSTGYRLEFWKKSVQFIAAAPVFGHGTGAIKELFRKAASGTGGASSQVTNQPHNETFLVAIQLGLVGAGLLFATWLSHLLLFRGVGLAAWVGTVLVVQNFVACLFNSYLSEFTLGWIYVFGVGVIGGAMLRQRDEAAACSDCAVGSVGQHPVRASHRGAI